MMWDGHHGHVETDLLLGGGTVMHNPGLLRDAVYSSQRSEGIQEHDSIGKRGLGCPNKP